MYKFRIFLLSTLFIGLAAKADEVYMAIVQTSTKYDGLVTIYKSPCTKPDGNVALASGKQFANGCWTFDGNRIKVEWFDSNVPNYYDKNAFHLITDTDIQKR